MQATTNTVEQIQDIKALVAEDFATMDQLISKQLSSSVPLIQTICEHIIHSGGKRLRPLCVLLTANALGYTGDEHITLAAIIEFIHTATLLHDDVIDESHLRRGKTTANAQWGNEASVLVGDFLYTRTIFLLTQITHPDILVTLSNITQVIVEGEVLQLVNRNQPNVSESQYMQVIACKTAQLFEAATKLAALISDAKHFDAASRYGHHLGMAFQLVDDALDYSGDSQTLGKNVGDDLAEGKPTLPLIRAYEQADADGKALIEQAVREGGIEHLAPILTLIEDANALEYTLDKAKEHAELAHKALADFPSSVYTEALHGLADLAVARSF